MWNEGDIFNDCSTGKQYHWKSGKFVLSNDKLIEEWTNLSRSKLVQYYVIHENKLYQKNISTQIQMNLKLPKDIINIISNYCCKEDFNVTPNLKEFYYSLLERSK